MHAYFNKACEWERLSEGKIPSQRQVLCDMHMVAAAEIVWLGLGGRDHQTQPFLIDL